ncbi:molybdopterin-binding protein [Stagnihabitans tardus]|uniref:Molybdopterin biosynthesis protein n=1 Tax=Stagnihabitans tardus TaxID=2699202 RepID=A0AAE4YCH9_9RHOB|nr:molybdopterin-binding protein [Stagnihabitans tardus]NBZ87120.1 molybdopterin biosynthesis protein [Stagnihabitans tardus]
MKFGPVPRESALGHILAHSEQGAQGKIPKGKVLTAEDLAALSHLAELTTAELAPGDIPENEAAALLAKALLPDDPGLALTPPHAGRVNLTATRPGILALDPAEVLALNRLDPALTLATLPLHARVSPGTLVGTVKVITYAVAGDSLAEALLRAPKLRILPVTRPSACLILTSTVTPDKLLQKGRDAIARRLARLGMTLTETHRLPHDEQAIAEAIAGSSADLILILTGAATSDLYDTAPQALRRAGGHVQRFGMPVDPGNLLFLGSLGATPVIGLPGCTRSPALNGADWVLERVACGLQVTDDDIAAMGVGGLLKEIPIRGQLREKP